MLSGSALTEKECPVDDFMQFAFQRGCVLFLPFSLAS